MVGNPHETGVRIPTKLELITAAGELGKGVEWIDEKLLYLSREDLYEWIAPIRTEEFRKSSIKTVEHLKLMGRTKEREMRFEAAHRFHGACWLTLGKNSKNLGGVLLDVLVLLEGSAQAGYLIPPEVLKSARRNDEGSLRRAYPVYFELADLKGEGEPLCVRFEGDKRKDGDQETVDSPVRELCSTLGVRIKDVRESVSRLVLCTSEEPWVALNHEAGKFRLGFSVDKSIKDRLVTAGLSLIVDTIVRSTETS